MTQKRSAFDPAPTPDTVRWVFGYGSLMWRPDFAHIDRQPAYLAGAHRALCIYSHVHRGTPERPGLVLGLNRGGACRGVAFKVADAAWTDVLAYLRAREHATMVYRECVRPVRLADRGETVMALCYVADRRHRQFAGDLPLETMVATIVDSTGQSGANVDYVLNTAAHLAEIGVADPKLFALARRLKEAV